jgi:hypothetical protein
LVIRPLQHCLCSTSSSFALPILLLGLYSIVCVQPVPALLYLICYLGLYSIVCVQPVPALLYLICRVLYYTLYIEKGNSLVVVDIVYQIYIFFNLQFLNHVIIIKIKVLHLPATGDLSRFMAIMFSHFSFLVLKDFKIIWLSNNSALSILDKSYSRNTLWTLNLIDLGFLLLFLCIWNLAWQN